MSCRHVRIDCRAGPFTLYTEEDVALTSYALYRNDQRQLACPICSSVTPYITLCLHIVHLSQVQSNGHYKAYTRHTKHTATFRIVNYQNSLNINFDRNISTHHLLLNVHHELAELIQYFAPRLLGSHYGLSFIQRFPISIINM